MNYRTINVADDDQLQETNDEQWKSAGVCVEQTEHVEAALQSTQIHTSCPVLIIRASLNTANLETTIRKAGLQKYKYKPQRHTVGMYVQHLG